MQINNTIQTQSIHQVAKDSRQTKTQQPTAAAPQSSLAQDVVQQSEIKKGLVPTLKGGGAGLLAGGVTGIGAVIAIDKATNMGSGALALLGIPMVGAPAAAVAGSVTVNLTNSKSKGALIGAGIGSVTALGVGAATGGLRGIIGPALTIGTLFGALGGATGAAFAKKD
ncbi:MAG: hypothetical protein IGS03_01045 [Candidatus Sericytochromatia bacterium]|nr:hypothetical protein [Candidatus Sericytochromatia bacterium]